MGVPDPPPDGPLLLLLEYESGPLAGTIRAKENLPFE